MEGIVYIGTKFIAYAFWCAIGVNLFRQRERIFLQGLKYGTIRLLLGAVVGVTLFFIAASMQVGNWKMSHVSIYLLMYVPLRWVEWSILAYLLQPNAAALLLAPRYRGANTATAEGPRVIGLVWKLGGILVSFLADLPNITASGGIDNMLPIGRFLC